MVTKLKTYDSICCESLEDIRVATDRLDKAKLVELSMDDSGVIKPLNGFKGVYNYTKGAYCTTVSNSYRLIQHKEYFDTFSEALSRLGMGFSIKIQQNGNVAYADISFKNNNVKFDTLNEEFTTGVRLVNSYDKSVGLFVAPLYTRLACANGMVVARAGEVVGIRHNSKLLDDIQSFIEKRMASLINDHADLKKWVSESMTDSIEWMTCCLITEKLFEHIKHREEILKRLGIALIEVKDKATKKKNVTYVWNDSSKKKDKITRWDFYACITNYLTFSEHLSPTLENFFQKQAEKILTTPLLEIQRRLHIEPKRI